MSRRGPHGSKVTRRKIYVVPWYVWPAQGTVQNNGYSLHADGKDAMTYVAIHRARTMFQNAATGLERPSGGGDTYNMWQTVVYDDGTLGDLPKSGDPYGVRIRPDDPHFAAASQLFANLPPSVRYGSKTIPFSFRL